MNAASPEVCKSLIMAFRRFSDDGRCALGWRPNLRGHGGNSLGDRCEVRVNASLACWWLEAFI